MLSDKEDTTLLNYFVVGDFCFSRKQFLSPEICDYMLSKSLSSEEFLFRMLTFSSYDPDCHD